MKASASCQMNPMPNKLRPEPPLLGSRREVKLAAARSYPLGGRRTARIMSSPFLYLLR